MTLNGVAVAQAGKVAVTTVLGGEDVLAGFLYRTRASASFAYDATYLARPDAFALAPSLHLFAGPQPIFPANPFSDSAPDTWGRKVLMRAAGRNLDEISLLLGVNDNGRQGATRFWVDGVAVADGEGVPGEHELVDVLRTADQVQRGERNIPARDVRRLFKATGSLGGARPKANVIRGGDLWLAKFPKPIGDDWNVMAWEASTLDLMEEANISVAPHETMSFNVDGEHRTVLFIRRFDRTRRSVRIPYMSAMTALESNDGAGGDWVDFVEWARTNGVDCSSLWRRAVFGVLVGNTDDHLRNHGFLRRNGSWSLSPAFDVNPTPQSFGDEHELALDGLSELSLEDFLRDEVADLFGVDVDHEWLKLLDDALSHATARAAAHGADSYSLSVMSDRFAEARESLAQAV
ncbi:type II toxin-antitoxin system HipA family toxin [Corynebacterium aquatimens]|uniref:Serine/threonine-protein kinase HipA n=1 Tax=Corynebacterium aquatimens TaxID=1190508 RepID=A0A931DWT3_9CORY|nr:type II toxin-antitoxin system HipA family toxin [Corynebacterium aquatimens]MBG6121712.1 serine/threonine-protein kinase HipA [Corynebacterium aquatimens]WJY65749.1 putative DNA-binding transcriptional regulator [Corynebacterium aquatimens]